LYLSCLFFSGNYARERTSRTNSDHKNCVKLRDFDLAAYSTLWHERFLDWPSVSPVPVHKDHITDWITAQTSKGLKFISSISSRLRFK